MGLLLLVRHGQASWDADDYDVLSPTGHAQSARLGEVWRAHGLATDGVVRGGMRRHRETAEEAFPGGAAEVDAGWDEFDHVTMLAREPAPFEGRRPTRAEFQTWFEAATVRWTSGDFEDYPESFGAFTARVDDALRRTAERSGTTVVVSSGGPIAWAATSLLAPDLAPADRVALWRRLNPVCANTGVTRVVTGRRGTTLVGFNETGHLDGTDLLTYR